ncbi:hypothetical protein FRB91_004566 [Serendipita sp. 411]|nr:hypothetical protein FRB91_004566 [Serendipita sp. 411]
MEKKLDRWLGTRSRVSRTYICQRTPSLDQTLVRGFERVGRSLKLDAIAYQATSDVRNPTGGASLLQHGADGGWYYPSGDAPVANSFYPYHPVPQAYRHPTGYEQPSTGLMTSLQPPSGGSESAPAYENAPIVAVASNPYGPPVNIPQTPLGEGNAFASTSNVTSPSPVSESPADTGMEDEVSQQEEGTGIPDEIKYKGSGAWDCTICDKTFRRKQRAMIHWMNKHGHQRLACDGACGATNW